MKKIFICIFLLLELAFSDFIVSPDALPQNIKDFLVQHFPDRQIGLVQRDKNTYDIYLSDGTEIECYLDGTWKDIEASYTPLSFSILPANIANIVKTEYPQAFLTEVKRKINYYKIKLSNNMELSIDFNGMVFKREFDD
ncbi:hypothetical protein DMB92_03300 [Campylobacter sp. MIT 99-7217]|uniref:PepSY-like domain-containing protein n=1 Tax=Campylobacter sp. MIT 99-7217 TaxID=535091 RepID=UPI00115AC240|nr:PepSY-like domain-containing protein [Campylobacter sp. MIT 99-7217]TQR33000.1 hypothetical protein DMB92_03300 [Campylobacter sp. MIT 99-7217]